MAELTTLARPYAKAAFEHARDAKDLDGWLKAITLAAEVSLEHQVEAMLFSPNYTDEQKADAFLEICGDKLCDAQKNFVRVMAENKRLGVLPEVHTLFELYKSNQEKTVDVDIQSAFEISKKLEQKLAETLTKKLDREVSLQTSIDESLLGGALIRAGDTVIDGSVRGRLAKLAEAMNA